MLCLSSVLTASLASQWTGRREMPLLLCDCQRPPRHPCPRPRPQQELFRQRSPTGSAEQSPAKREAAEGEAVLPRGWLCTGRCALEDRRYADLTANPKAGMGIDPSATAPAPTGDRLQYKLQEWQQRLESAAKLKTASADRRGGGAAGGAAGGSSHSVDGSSPVSSSGSLGTGQATCVLAAIEAAAAMGSPGSDEAVSASSDLAGECLTASSAGTTASVHSAASSGSAAADVWASLPGSPASPRIPAARPEAAAEAEAQPAAALEQPAAACPPGTASTAGSRIKRMGQQAAAASPLRKAGKAGPPRFQKVAGRWDAAAAAAAARTAG